MRQPASATFFRQARRFRLRFCCDDCAYFDDLSERCAHGWPVADHRRERYQREQAEEIIYCKEYELR